MDYHINTFSIIDLLIMLSENITDEDNDYEENGTDTAETMVNYYAPLFNRELRTDSFLNAFKYCFTESTNALCSEYPRPIICNHCCKKFIDCAENAIKSIEDDTIINNIVKIIIPRLNEVNDITVLLTENAPHNTNIDDIYSILNIDMSIYDPPSKEILDQCENYKYSNNTNNDSCVICICEFEEQEEVKKLTCNHIFHKSCIEEWLKNHSTCPVCKHSLK